MKLGYLIEEKPCFDRDDGVGKSTIGKNLALNLSYNFIDIDQVIEKKEGSSIKIFLKIKVKVTLEKLKMRLP